MTRTAALLQRIAEHTDTVAIARCGEESELARVQCTAPGNRGENVTGLRMVEKLMMTWCGGENLLLSTSMHFSLKPALSGSSVHYALCFVP